MLRRLTKRKELEKYLDFAYGLALEPSYSGYPTYADGVKTRQDFIRQAQEALGDEKKGIFLLRFIHKEYVRQISALIQQKAASMPVLF